MGDADGRRGDERTAAGRVWRPLLTSEVGVREERCTLGGLGRVADTRRAGPLRRGGREGEVVGTGVLVGAGVVVGAEEGVAVGAAADEDRRRVRGTEGRVAAAWARVVRRSERARLLRVMAKVSDGVG